MKNKKVVIGAIILVAIIVLGVGFALISNIGLNITGDASASPDDANFTVKFTGTPTVSDQDNVEAAITNDKTATIKVSGLTAKGDSETATYTISNASPDLSANLTASVTKNTNTEYFNVDYKFAETTVKSNNTTTVTVTVSLIKTPMTADEATEIAVALTASPAQPTTTTTN